MIHQDSYVSHQGGTSICVIPFGAQQSLELSKGSTVDLQLL